MSKLRNAAIALALFVSAAVVGPVKAGAQNSTAATTRAGSATANDPTVDFQANVSRATATLDQIYALIDAIDKRHQSQGAPAPGARLERQTPVLAVRNAPVSRVP